MIKEIQFQKYRIFSEIQNLRLAPITVVFGKNNVGKSAILKLPLLIKNAFDCKTDDVLLPLLSDGSVLFDNPRDLIYGKANQAIRFSITSDNGANLNFSFFVENDAMQPKTHLEEWSITNNDTNQILHRSEEGIMITEEGTSVKFLGINPINDKFTNYNSSEFFQDVFYLKAVRESPQRDYRLSFNSSNIGSSLLYDILIKDALEVQHPLLDKVSKWYEKNFDGWKVSIDKHRSPIFSIELENDNVRNNILDTGMGIVQSLPIVISAYRTYENPSLIILEEPETHLHPAAHGELSQLLAEESNESKRFLIETHSQNFIMRLRCLIAEGVLNRDNVALYYVDYNEEKQQSKLVQINIDKNGDVENWPDKIFSDTLEEALKLRRAQNNMKYEG